MHWYFNAYTLEEEYKNKTIYIKDLISPNVYILV